MTMSVSGQGCSGYAVSFEIYDEDPGLDDHIKSVSGVFPQNGTRLNVNTVVTSDEFRAAGGFQENAQIEVYFEAKAGNSKVRSPIVPVTAEEPPLGSPGSTNSSGPGPTGRPISFDFKFDNPLGGGEQNLLDLINTISRWIFNLAIPIAVIFIIYGGILFLTAGANPTNVDEGKKILKYAVIGLAIVFIGRGFVSLVHSVIKLGDTTTATPTTQPR